MAISKRKYLRLFIDEFRENLLAAENQIILLKNDQGNVDALSTLLRTLHNMKGSARMLQFGNIESLVHGMETVFKGVREGRYSVDARLVRFFFIVADRLRFAADSVEAEESDLSPDHELLLAACEKLGANESFDLSSIAPLQRAASTEGRESIEKPEPFEAARGVEDRAASGPASGSASGTAGDIATGIEQKEKTARAEPRVESPATPRAGRLDSSIRVDAEAIDASISLVNTLTIRQLRLRSGGEELDALEKRLGALYYAGSDVKALRKEVADLTRVVRHYRSQNAEQLFEIEHGTQELREVVIGMRMLPLSVILERFPRMVEEAASALGKDVSLAIVGDTVRLDRTVLNKLADPLMHLVRNSIDHGIESAQAREKAGKSARGSVRIECRTEGNRISVSVSDDGAGLDYPAIRARALSVWPESEADIARMADEDLIRFLFRPGFTTKTTSTTLSGRGIGLDVVKTNVEAAKGQIHIDSRPGAGCTFTLLLPVSASTMDGMFVLCSGKKYFIPATAIKRTLLVDSGDRFQIRQKEMFSLAGENIALAELSLGLQVEQQQSKAKKFPVLLVRGATETVGIVVERILGYDSLVYQSLPSGLRRHTLIQGIVFDASFNIIPILNMWTVLDRLRSVRLMDTRRRYVATQQAEKPTVLVVDDSISTREIEISMLELEGYEVIGAIDGVDALEKIRGSRFDVIVSDLNMPRMDGLKLLENIRNDEALKQLPVIFVTTVDEPETRMRAESLGVDKYILKSSFDQDNLISAVRELVSSERLI